MHKHTITGQDGTERRLLRFSVNPDAFPPNGFPSEFGRGPESLPRNWRQRANRGIQNAQNAQRRMQEVVGQAVGRDFQRAMQQGMQPQEWMNNVIALAQQGSVFNQNLLANFQFDIRLVGGSPPQYRIALLQRPAPVDPSVFYLMASAAQHAQAFVAAAPQPQTFAEPTPVVQDVPAGFALDNAASAPPAVSSSPPSPRSTIQDAETRVPSISSWQREAIEPGTVTIQKHLNDALRTLPEALRNYSEADVLSHADRILQTLNGVVYLASSAGQYQRVLEQIPSLLPAPHSFPGTGTALMWDPAMRRFRFTAGPAKDVAAVRARNAKEAAENKASNEAAYEKYAAQAVTQRASLDAFDKQLAAQEGALLKAETDFVSLLQTNASVTAIDTAFTSLAPLRKALAALRQERVPSAEALARTIVFMHNVSRGGTPARVPDAPPTTPRLGEEALLSMLDNQEESQRLVSRTSDPREFRRLLDLVRTLIPRNSARVEAFLKRVKDQIEHRSTEIMRQLWQKNTADYFQAAVPGWTVTGSVVPELGRAEQRITLTLSRRSSSDTCSVQLAVPSIIYSRVEEAHPQFASISAINISDNSPVNAYLRQPASPQLLGAILADRFRGTTTITQLPDAADRRLQRYADIARRFMLEMTDTYHSIFVVPGGIEFYRHSDGLWDPGGTTLLTLDDATPPRILIRSLSQSRRADARQLPIPGLAGQELTSDRLPTLAAIIRTGQFPYDVRRNLPAYSHDELVALRDNALFQETLLGHLGIPMLVAGNYTLQYAPEVGNTTTITISRISDGTVGVLRIDRNGGAVTVVSSANSSPDAQNIRRATSLRDQLRAAGSGTYTVHYEDGTNRTDGPYSLMRIQPVGITGPSGRGLELFLYFRFADGGTMQVARLGGRGTNANDGFMWNDISPPLIEPRLRPGQALPNAQELDRILRTHIAPRLTP